METVQAVTRQSFFRLTAAFVLAVVLIGFARTLYLRPVFQGEGLPGHLYLHGAVLTAWFLVFFTQALLIAGNRVATHRLLGTAGAVLALAVIAVSLMTVVRRDAPVIDEAPYRALGNVSSLIGFGILVGAGIWLRGRSAFHRRLMLLGSIQITAPALDRVAQIPAVSVLVDPILPDALGPTEIGFALVGTLTLVAAVFVYDVRSRGRPHKATVLGAVRIFVIGPTLSAAFMFSGGWAAFVRLLS